MADNNPLNFDLEQMRCVTTLLRHGVEFLIVGGYAVRYHGHMRPAKDVDVLVGNDQHNAERLSLALADILHKPLPKLAPEAFVGQKRQVNFEALGLKFEVLTAADGVDFQDAYAHRARETLGAAEIPVIGKDALIIMKRRAGRAVDLSDVEALEKEN